jgi:hypothetical protein
MTPFTDHEDGTQYLAGVFALMILVLGIGLWEATQRTYPESVYGARIVRSLGLGAAVRVREGSAPVEVTVPNLQAAVPHAVAPAEGNASAEQPDLSGFVASEPVGPSPGDRVRVVGTDGLGVVLRTEPREDARVPRGLLEGTRATVLQRAGQFWALVRADSGVEGWVPIRYLAAIEPR